MGWYILKTRGDYSLSWRQRGSWAPGEKEYWTDWNRAFQRFNDLANDGAAPVMWSSLPQAKPDWSRVRG